MTYSPDTLALDSSALESLSDDVRRAEEALDRAVLITRDKGMSWLEIARALGTSPAVVQHRYGRRA